MYPLFVHFNFIFRSQYCPTSGTVIGKGKMELHLFYWQAAEEMK